MAGPIRKKAANRQHRATNSEGAAVKKEIYKRGPWNNTEDECLIAAVKTMGTQEWMNIKDHVDRRSAKQCRERWHQNLDPKLSHDAISEDEAIFIFSMVERIGSQWAEIARSLGNRSDNAVKNFYNGQRNRQKRLDEQQKNHYPVVPASHPPTAPYAPVAPPASLQTAQGLPTRSALAPSMICSPPHSRPAPAAVNATQNAQSQAPSAPTVTSQADSPQASSAALQRLSLSHRSVVSLPALSSAWIPVPAPTQGLTHGSAPAQRPDEFLYAPSRSSPSTHLATAIRRNQGLDLPPIQTAYSSTVPNALVSPAAPSLTHSPPTRQTTANSSPQEDEAFRPRLPDIDWSRKPVLPEVRMLSPRQPTTTPPALPSFALHRSPPSFHSSRTLPMPQPKADLYGARRAESDLHRFHYPAARRP